MYGLCCRPYEPAQMRAENESFFPDGSRGREFSMSLSREPKKSKKARFHVNYVGRFFSVFEYFLLWRGVNAERDLSFRLFRCRFHVMLFLAGGVDGEHGADPGGDPVA